MEVGTEVMEHMAADDRAHGGRRSSRPRRARSLGKAEAGAELGGARGGWREGKKG